MRLGLGWLGHIPRQLQQIHRPASAGGSGEPERARGLVVAAAPLQALAALAVAHHAGKVHAHAGLMDFLSGKKSDAPSEVRASLNQRVWRIGEFTAIRIVPSEAGAEPNVQRARV